MGSFAGDSDQCSTAVCEWVDAGSGRIARTRGCLPLRLDQHQGRYPRDKSYVAKAYIVIQIFPTHRRTTPVGPGIELREIRDRRTDPHANVGDAASLE